VAVNAVGSIYGAEVGPRTIKKYASPVLSVDPVELDPAATEIDETDD
jgi:hypothetical protein